MKRLIIVIGLSVLSSCKPSVNVEGMKTSIAASFEEQTKASVDKVDLVRTEDYKYTGIVILKDKTQAGIEVTIDKDNPDQYIWKCTTPSPSMLDKAYNEAWNKPFK